ncbi:hypothetical protein Tco_1486460 [Tanacetum coccineum]
MPQAKKGPIIIGQHYGLSDLSGFQNTQGGPTFLTQASTSFFEGAQATPSYDQHTSSRYPYSHPATLNWNKGRNANVAPFKLGNAFVDDNEVDHEVLITGVRDTDDYIVYENVDPSKPIYLDYHIMGYSVSELFWRELVPNLYMGGYQVVDDPNIFGDVSLLIEV